MIRPHSAALWLRVGLLGSLALNVLLAAFLSGAWWRARVAGTFLPAALVGDAPAMRTSEGLLQRAVLSIPRADRRVLRGIIASHAGELLADQRDFLDAVRAVRMAAMAEPVDPAALRAAVRAARLKRQEIGQPVEDMIVEAATRLSPEARRALAEFRPR